MTGWVAAPVLVVTSISSRSFVRTWGAARRWRIVARMAVAVVSEPAMLREGCVSFENGSVGHVGWVGREVGRLYIWSRTSASAWRCFKPWRTKEPNMSVRSIFFGPYLSPTTCRATLPNMTVSLKSKFDLIKKYHRDLTPSVYRHRSHPLYLAQTAF